MRFLSLSLLVAVSVTSAPAQAHDEAQKLFATPPVQHGSFGAWVSADSGTMVVGANGYAVGAGRLAVVFERVGGIWQQVAELSITNLVAGYVTPVAVDGTTIMLGDFGGETVHVFERIGGVWTPTQVLSASQPLPEAHFGRRIVIDGDRAAIAAPMDAATELRGGAVYIFERIAAVWR